MRIINETIQILVEKKVDATVVSEDFSHYVINKREKTINAVVAKMDEKGDVVVTENYYFENEGSINNFTESSLWFLIDKKRAELEM